MPVDTWLNEIEAATPADRNPGSRHLSRHASTRYALAAMLAIAVAGAASSASAQMKYDTGATDNEIKIGNIMPYSGPASAYGVIGTVEAAYFRMINEQGGIGGRKINFITYDDGYSPPKAVEQAQAGRER